MENNEDLKRWWEIMKKYYKVVWTIFFIQLIVIAIVIKTAKVDDVTLAKGKVEPFNTG